MKKKYLLILIACFLFPINYVIALSLNLNSSNYSLTKGSSTKISLTVSANDAIFSIEGTLKCSGAGVNGGIDLNYDNMDNNVTSKSYSYTIKPTSVGTVTCSATGVRLTTFKEGSWQNISDKSITIKVTEPATIVPKTYSSNNYLKSLEVENYQFDVDFNKETKEYSISLPSKTEKINIKATAEDNRASISGIGEINVSEGINNIGIIVTAENGNKRTYTIKADVQELEPIEVLVVDEKYTIIRKKELLPKISDYYTETEVTISNEKIPAYTNQKLNYTLVALKDSKGNIEYYIYENNRYTLYKEYTFGMTTLQLLDKSLDSNYKKTTFTYDSDEIIGYQENKPDLIKNTYALDTDNVISNNFYLFYAKNIETGKESLYQYDSLEKTIQRYNVELLDMYKNANNIYYLVILGLVVFVILLIIIYSVLLNKTKKRNKKKKLNKHTMDFIDDE